MISRRLFSIALLLTVSMAVCDQAMAKEDGEGGNDGGRSEGGNKDDGGKDDGGKDDGGKDDGGKDDGGKDDGGQDYDDDRIRRAVRDGSAKPLRLILKSVRSRFDGQVVRVRLTKRSGELLYRIRMIDSKNRLIDVFVEAASGRVVTPSGIY